MDYEQLIRNWHVQAGNEDYFSRYVFEYLAFIAYLKRVKFTNKNTDSGAVRALKDSEDIRDIYIAEVANNASLQKAWLDIKAELDLRPLGEVDENTDQVRTIWYWDCDCQNVRNRQTHICEQQGQIRNLEDWRNMVEFWHSIRNNFFHGGKDPHDDRDQLLVRGGFETLRPLMERLLK